MIHYFKTVEQCTILRAQKHDVICRKYAVYLLEILSIEPHNTNFWQVQVLTKRLDLGLINSFSFNVNEIVSVVGVTE